MCAPGTGSYDPRGINSSVGERLDSALLRGATKLVPRRGWTHRCRVVTLLQETDAYVPYF